MCLQLEQHWLGGMQKTVEKNPADIYIYTYIYIHIYMYRYIWFITWSSIVIRTFVWLLFSITDHICRRCLCIILYGSCIRNYISCARDLSHESHNAPGKYPTMRRFVTEIWTIHPHGLISLTVLHALSKFDKKKSFRYNDNSIRGLQIDPLPGGMVIVSMRKILELSLTQILNDM